MEARLAMTMPMPLATYRASRICRWFSSSGSRTAGSTPQAPAVGAATIRRMQALDSAMPSASAMTSLM